MSVESVNSLIKRSIEQNNYSKKAIALKAGMSEKKLRRILNADDIDVSSLFSICNALGTSIVLEFSNGQGVPLRLPLIVKGDEQSK